MGLFGDLIGGALEVVTAPLDITSDVLNGNTRNTERKIRALKERTRDIVEDIEDLDLL